jgi:hypothetical protein
MTGKDGAWSYTIADDYTSSAHPLPNKRTTTVASARLSVTCRARQRKAL